MIVSRKSFTQTNRGGNVCTVHTGHNYLILKIKWQNTQTHDEHGWLHTQTFSGELNTETVPIKKLHTPRAKYLSNIRRCGFFDFFVFLLAHTKWIYKTKTEPLLMVAHHWINIVVMFCRIHLPRLKPGFDDRKGHIEATNRLYYWNRAKKKWSGPVLYKTKLNRDLKTHTKLRGHWRKNLETACQQNNQLEITFD